MSGLHIIGMAITLALVAGVSIYSGRKVKSAADFDVGGKRAGSIEVAAAIMGTLVGGSSTIGTAQLAFDYGMSAWWFTLGGGIACLLLALFFIVPMRAKNRSTIVEIISAEFGKTAGVTSALLSSAGTFINIISQLLSATAILALVFPRMDILSALLLTAALMALYVVFGGVRGAAMVGQVKLLLIYLTVIVSGVTALRLGGGVGAYFAELDHQRYFHLFARGVGKDAGAGLSLLLGVLCTQSYAQAFLAGKTDAAARRGALISAVMVPIVGIGGILVGLYMRRFVPELASAKLALPQFISTHMPPVLCGVIFAALFIAVVGTGAGLALGISSTISNNLVKSWKSPRQKLLFSRALIMALLLAACFLSTGTIGDTILGFAFMSMGLRGAVIFAPLCCALWLPGRVDRRWATAGIVAGPLTVLLFGLLGTLPFDPLFMGIFVAMGCCAVGCVVRSPLAGFKSGEKEGRHGH